MKVSSDLEEEEKKKELVTGKSVVFLGATAVTVKIELSEKDWLAKKQSSLIRLLKCFYFQKTKNIKKRMKSWSTARLPPPWIGRLVWPNKTEIATKKQHRQLINYR